MRKAWYLPLIAMVFTACTNGEAPEEQVKSENTIRNYLSVNILTPVSGTRDDVNPKYEDGSDSENYINYVRFYFFDGEGNASEVRKQGSSDNGASSSYLSYIDWVPTDADNKGGGDANQTVEKILSATLGINMPAETTDLPELILAVLNPPQEILSMEGNPKLSDILQLVADYQTGLTSDNFVITNSVYVNGAGDLIDATHITDVNFQPTQEAAVQNAVNIYVERVVARLDLSIGISSVEDSQGIYQLGNKTYSIDGEEAEPMYVKLLGWNVTATTKTSRLVKLINVDWNDNIFGTSGEPWNISELHRSFWAINPKDVEYQYGPFTTKEGETKKPNTADALPIPTNGVTSVYLQENANPYDAELTAEDPTEPSKVILAAQLVDATGEPQNLIRWANRLYTETGALNAITNSLNLYYQSTDNGVSELTKIDPEDGDLKFVSAFELYGKTLPEDVADYFVYVQLSEDGEKKTWYNGKTSSTPLTTTQVNEYILNTINHLLYWQNGYAYYYLDIRHLGALGTPGYAGVVRNHLYKAKVTGIEGLGTPVYEPDREIHPEMPGYDDTVLSADIRILQWRVVSQDYNFVWP